MARYRQTATTCLRNGIGCRVEGDGPIARGRGGTITHDNIFPVEKTGKHNEAKQAGETKQAEGMETDEGEKMNRREGFLIF